MKILSIEEKREQAYCDQCDEPRLLLILKSKGWPYKVKICSDCLNALAKLLEHDPIRKEINGKN